MAIPRILLAVPLIIAGIVVPAAGAAPMRPPPHAVSMEHEMFAQKSVTIHVGQTLTMVNNSLWIHIIGPGRDGKLTAAPKGVPVITRRLMQTNDVYTTGPWNTPGRFYLTCSVHPEMTVLVIVTQ
jgi:plastocyanin